MPQTTALVCFLKSVVALAGEKKRERRPSWKQVKDCTKRGGGGDRLRGQGIIAVVNKQITDTAHTEDKKISRQRNKKKKHCTPLITLFLLPLRLGFLQNFYF